MWTVEWVDAEGQKQISDSCPASSSIEELYSHKQLEDGNALKRKPGEHAKEAQKRRRKERLAESQLQQEKSNQDASATGTAGADEKVEHPSSDVQPNSDPAETELAATEISQTVPKNGDEGPDQQDDADVPQHFYLLRTSTNAKQKVLIPLSREATLTSCLKDRTVMEFPTIYILPYAPDSLPKEYLLEEQYLKLQKSERQELRDAIAKAEKKGVFEHVSRAETAARNAPAMDANSILNVLKRDLTR